MKKDKSYLRKEINGVGDFRIVTKNGEYKAQEYIKKGFIFSKYVWEDMGIHSIGFYYFDYVEYFDSYQKAFNYIKEHIDSNLRFNPDGWKVL